MQNKKRNGFTLTELIVVIAIIGILLAVLIPLLTGYIGKAQVSNDTRLVRNLNAALADDSALNLYGAKHANMTEALKAADAEGYDLGKINASKRDNEILWDGANDVFVYLKADGTLEYIPNSVEESKQLDKDSVDLWRIQDVKGTLDTVTNKMTATLTGKNSVYARNCDAEVVNTLAGFDAGDVSTITAVTYDRSSALGQTVVIRTNGGELTVNAPADTVRHYGFATDLTIKSVDENSFHEYGTVATVDISNGRFVLESGSDVQVVHFSTAVDSNNQKTDTFNNIKVAYAPDVELPTFTRDAVETIAAGGTLVVELQHGTDATKADKDKIYLFQNGIYEQIKVESATSTKFADEEGVKSESSQVAEDIANNFTGSVRPTWAANDTTRELTNITNTTEIATALAQEEAGDDWNDMTAEEKAEAVASKTSEVTNAQTAVSSSGVTAEESAQLALFAGGKGTKNDPYLIANGNQWYNLLTKYQGYYMGSSTDGLYVVLKGDIDITGYDITSYNSYPRNFHLDGNGFTMKNFETSIWGEDGTLYLTNTFTNLKLENCHSSDNSLFGGTQNSNTASVTFNNVDLNNCSAVGGAYQYYDGSATATFIDCDAINTNVLGGYMASGGFIGNISTGVIVIDHCSFGGSVVSTQSACGGFVGQSANYDANMITIKDSTIIAGTVIRNVAGGNVAAFNAHTGTQDYAQFNNSFYGTLETTGTKYKQGTDAATKTYEPICTAADFTLNSDDGTLTYNGSAGLGKIAVQVYVTMDEIYNGKYYGGYNSYVCDPIKANDVVNGTTISGIPVITDFYNVVSSTDTPVGLQTTDTTYVDEIHDGTFYFDAQTYSWGYCMLGGTYNKDSGVAVEPTSLKVYIKVTVYDNSGSLMGVVSGATLNYSVDLSNHGN